MAGHCLSVCVTTAAYIETSMPGNWYYPLPMRGYLADRSISIFLPPISRQTTDQQAQWHVHLKAKSVSSLEDQEVMPNYKHPIPTVLMTQASARQSPTTSPPKAARSSSTSPPSPLVNGQSLYALLCQARIPSAATPSKQTWATRNPPQRPSSPQPDSVSPRRTANYTSTSS